MFFAIFVAVLVGIAIMAVFAGLLNLLSREHITDRMYEIVQSGAMDTGGSRASSGTTQSVLKRLDRRILSRGLGANLTDNLIQADLKVSATEFVLVQLGLTLVGALIGYSIARQPISALLAGVICFFLPRIFVQFRKAKRRREFNNQLAEALAQIAGSLRAGYSIPQSISSVADQMPSPAGDEFKRVVREVQLGQPLIIALTHMLERIESDDLRMVVTSISINQQVGGNLAEILETVSETIRERVRIKREIQVLTSQQRYSGYVLVALPIALGVFLTIINPTYQLRLFDPGITLCIPIGASISMVVGFIAMRRIVDIDV